MAQRLARRHLVAPRLTTAGVPATVVQIRESSIVSLATHGLLDAGQVSAAMQFREAWQLVAIAANPRRQFERVDGGRHPARTEAEIEARAALKRVRFITGEHGFGLLVKVCGEGFHIRDLYPTRRERDTATDVLRIHLSALACACLKA